MIFQYQGCSNFVSKSTPLRLARLASPAIFPRFF
eukprot:UN21485